MSSELAFETLHDSAFTPHHYQTKAIESVTTHFYEKGRKAASLVLATGTGKTVVMAELVRNLVVTEQVNRALFVVHRNELVKQAIETFELAGLAVGREQGSQHGMALCNPNIICSTVQSMAVRKAKYDPQDFDLILVDECFPAGSLVDGIPIENIRPGDLVLTFNESTGDLESKPVKRSLASVPTELISIRFSDGSKMTVTANHPVFSRNGEWVNASELLIGDVVYGRRMQDLRKIDEEARKSHSDNVFKRVFCNFCVTNHGFDEPCACICSHEVQQPYEQAGCAGETGVQAEGNWMQAPSARWKREGNVSCRKDSVRSDGAESYNGTHNAGITATFQDSESLQNRSGVQRNPASGRDRRSLAQFKVEEGAGSTESGLSEFARVDGITFHEQTSDGTFGGLCKGGVTYNLEIEGNNNYFVGGVLVHNCHHFSWDNKQYRGLVEYFDTAKLLGVTATPDRPDGKDMTHFNEVVYSYNLFDAIHDPQGPFLSPVRFVRCDVGVDLRGCRTIGHKGDFDAAELGKRIQPAIEIFANAIAKEIADRQKIIVFMPCVGSSTAMANALKDLGFRADWVSGDRKDKDQVIQDYKKGRLQILVNCQLLLEGFDDKETDTVVLKPTRSRVAYAQAVGRGTRLYPGKKDCLVIDFSHTSDLDLVGPASLAVADIEDAKAIDKLVDQDDDGDLWGAIERNEENKKQRRIFHVPVSRMESMEYRRVEVNPFQTMINLGTNQTQLTSNSFSELASEPQISFLAKSGMGDLGNISKRQASELISKIIDRRTSGLCSLRQLNYLISLGVKPDKARHMSFREATETISVLRVNS